MTTTAPTDQAPEAYGFGFAEIAYILASAPGPATGKSTEVMRLRDEVANERLCVAGASSLLARGFSAMEGESLILDGPAAAVAYALAHANRWTEISLIAEDIVDTVVHVESAEVSILLQPRAVQTWFAFAQDPAIDGAEAILQMLQEHVREYDAGSAHLRARSLTDERDLLVRHDPEGWAIGTVVDPAADVEEQTGLAARDILQAIRDLHSGVGAGD
jgi:hypothetical protein